MNYTNKFEYHARCGMGGVSQRSSFIFYLICVQFDPNLENGDPDSGLC